MNDWFRFGSKVGRFSITGPRLHGTGLQRYDALDHSNKKPVRLTCAKPNRKTWALAFEELIAKRAQIPFGPRIMDWGITQDDIFFIAEESSKVDSLSSLPLAVSTVHTLFHALADELADFAEVGFVHGALDPRETVGLVNGDLVIFGAGFRQILGCMQGLGVLGSELSAPEMLEGEPWNEHADVFSVCAIMASLWRGRCAEKMYWSGLGRLGGIIKEGMLRDLDERPSWSVLNPGIKHLVGHLIEANAKEMQANSTSPPQERKIQAITEEWASQGPANSPPPKVESEKKRKASRQPANQTDGLELFAEWEIDHTVALERNDIAVFMCQPFALEDVHLLRRVRPATLGVQTLNLAELAPWKEKRIKLDKGNMPPFVDAGITNDGWVYWVEQYMGARTLPDRMREANGARAERIQALRAVISAGKVLEACAATGLFHGDLLPDRDLVFADDDDKVYVMGIGAFQAFGLQNTVPRSIYAAPERQYAKDFDQRSDIFALGVALCECITGIVPAPGAKPFPGEGLEWWLKEVIEMATAKDPADRFQTWGAFLAALRRCLQAFSSTTAKRKAPKRVTVRRRSAAPSMAASPTTPNVPTIPSLQEVFAHTPKNPSQGPDPSSSDPKPSPAPQGHAGTNGEATDLPVLDGVLNASQNASLTKALECTELDRPTLPCIPFPPKIADKITAAPAKQRRASRWIGSGLGLVGAAAFLFFWWARIPELAPTSEAHGPTALEGPALLWKISTAEGVKSIKTEAPTASPPSRNLSANRLANAERRITRACIVGYCGRGREGESQE